MGREKTKNENKNILKVGQRPRLRATQFLVIIILIQCSLCSQLSQSTKGAFILIIYIYMCIVCMCILVSYVPLVDDDILSPFHLRSNEKVLIKLIASEIVSKNDVVHLHFSWNFFSLFFFLFLLLIFRFFFLHLQTTTVCFWYAFFSPP